MNGCVTHFASTTLKFLGKLKVVYEICQMISNLTKIFGLYHSIFWFDQGCINVNLENASIRLYWGEEDKNSMEFC